MKKNILKFILYILGDKLSYRIGRALYMLARDDINNDISTNGELYVQSRVVQAVIRNGDEELCCFDVGANIGDWSIPLLSYCKAKNFTGLRLYMFEPVPSTLKILQKNIKSNVNIKLENIAISSSVGTSPMYIEGIGAGTNTMHFQTDNSGLEVINIQTTTAYQFCVDKNIDNIHLMKCDTEGHDAEVIIGALPLLQEGRIGTLQFEYNHRWVFSKHYLKDVFDLIEGLEYKLGKICSDHIKVYPTWHYELDRFFEANYILIREDVLCWFDIREYYFDEFNVPSMKKVS